MLRLGLLCDRGLYESLENSAKYMGANELLGLKAFFEKRLEEKFPPKTQLLGRAETVSFDGAEFIV